MSAPVIHPTAVVSDQASLGKGVRLGPFVVIEGRVVVGEGTVVGPHSWICGPATIGKDNQIYGKSALGTDPQDLKYSGEKSALVVGNGNKIREFVTVNRGTRLGSGKTQLGDGNLLMTGVHVAHDCVVGNGVVLGNSATLGGHVGVDDYASVAAFSGVHQFCRVGCHAFVGGYSVLTRDALPFVKTVGQRSNAAIFGINTIGLQRRGFNDSRIEALKGAYRILFRKGLPLKEAVARMRRGQLTSDVEVLLDFVESTERGFVRKSTGPRQVPAAESSS